MQDRQTKVQKKKKSIKSTEKQLEIPPLIIQRTLKTTDQILTQRSPITGTTKNTIETKRSMSPEELKSFRKSTNYPKQRSPLFTEKQKHNKKLSIQLFIKEKKRSGMQKEKLLYQKILNDKQQKLLNQQKLQQKTKRIFENAQKLKLKNSMKKKQKRQKIDEIITRFEEISKRYENIQLDQISKFQSKVANHQQSCKSQLENETQNNIDKKEALNEFQLHQSALLIQIQWKEYKKNKEKKKYSQTKIQQINSDLKPQQLVSQQLSPINSEDSFLFCQEGQKQPHFTNIKSQIISEESISMVNQLNSEFENWNLFTQRIVKDKDISNINKQMQQQVISIIQNHIKQSRNFSERKSQNQALQEKSINSPQNVQSEDLTKTNVLQLQRQVQQEEKLILKYREEALYLRYDIEQKNATEEDQQRLEEWLNRELEDLQQTRKTFEIGHRRQISTLKKIQRDILIASAELQSDLQDSLQIQQINEQIDKQFNSLKVTKQNYKSQQEISESVDLVTMEILNDIILDFSDELMNKKDDLYLIISNLIVNQDVSPCVPTSMSDIQQYIDNLFNYILKNQKELLIQNLNTPFGITPKERMKLMHGNEEDDIDNDNQEFQNKIGFPMDETIFIEFEDQRISAIDNDDEIECAILQLQQIHNKAIFDACNEILNSYRPYYYNSGIKYPWDQNRINLQQIQNQSLEQILENVKSIVLKQSKVLCGFYPTDDFETVKQEKQEIIDEKNILMLMQQLTLVENPLLVDANVQFDNLGLIRDEQLQKLLIEDIKEQEYKWFLFEDDRTEYLMELSDQILETLIEEFSKEI